MPPIDYKPDNYFSLPEDMDSLSGPSGLSMYETENEWVPFIQANAGPVVGIPVGLYSIREEPFQPVYSTEFSACFDLHAYIPNDGLKGFGAHNDKITPEPLPEPETNTIKVMPLERMLIPTGFEFDIPSGYSMRIHPRSGASIKEGLVLANMEGVIDADYTEEVFIPVINFSENPIFIKHGERIAQGEIVPVVNAMFETLSEPVEQKTTRSGGFGHTGK